MRISLFWLIAIFFCSVSADSQQHQSYKSEMNVMSPEDLFRLEQIGDVVYSPDGRLVAFEISRPAGESNVPLLSPHWLHSDIWIMSILDGKPKRITDGKENLAGYWHPLWSPDSKRLAILSIKNAIINVHIWESETGRLTQISNYALMDAPISDSMVGWVSDSKIAFFAWPENHRKPTRTYRAELFRPGENAIEYWSKAWTAQEKTVDVLDSGNDSTPVLGQKGVFISVDVISGDHEVILEDDLHHLHISPDKRFAAFFTGSQKVPSINENSKFTYPNVLLPSIHGSSLHIIDLNQGTQLHEPTLLDQPDHGSLEWSPDGEQVAFLGRLTDSTSEKASDKQHIIRIKAVDGALHEIEDANREIKRFAWNGNHELLVYAQSKSESDEAHPNWWFVDETGRWINLTEDMDTVPQNLFRINEGMNVAGLADGNLWTINPGDRTINCLTENIPLEIANIVWPRSNAKEMNAVDRIIVRVKNSEPDTLHVLDSSSKNLTISPITKPSKRASLKGMSPAGNTAMFALSDSTGTYLWLTKETNNDFDASVKVVESNIWLRKIQEGEVRKIEYKSLRGEELKGWVILPVEYREGKQYPLVVWVYAGNVYRDRRPSATQINRIDPDHLQLLAARGYAVLLPSMPLEAWGETSDPYMDLTNGVLPAVDRLVELGIVDAHRLGLFGRSFGGYSVYGLVTQTDRFQAAIARSGMVDLVSLYGVSDPRSRYGDMRHSQISMLGRMLFLEDGQMRMGSPPWKDSARYIRNSPMTYVDQVNTPIMSIHGDNDAFPIQQAEQFFSALYRQGKRARFVRYFGESHAILRKPNVLDMWQRIYAWFDEFLKPQ